MHRSSSSQHAHAPLYPLSLVCSLDSPAPALQQRRLLQLRHELIDVLDLYESAEAMVLYLPSCCQRANAKEVYILAYLASTSPLGGFRNRDGLEPGCLHASQHASAEAAPR
jgi:hypothetical protein